MVFFSLLRNIMYLFAEVFGWRNKKVKNHLSIHLFICNYPGFGSGGSRLNRVFPDTPIP